MKNPVFAEYQRARLFGIVLVIALSCFAALVHYWRSVEDNVAQSKARLNLVAMQLDSQLLPLQAYIGALQRAALMKLQLPPMQEAQSIALLSFNTLETSQQAAVADNDIQTAELQMLLRLQPYFDVVNDTQPFIKGIYYLSEQGFGYNGQHRWSDYIAEQVSAWRDGTSNEISFDRNTVFYPTFVQEQAALMLPLYQDDKKLGRFLFAIDLQQLLTPLYQLHADADFMLLDQSGNIISGSSSRQLQSIDQHLLQVQRLNSAPWSLAVLKPKTSLFAVGFAAFLWHWFLYALLLGTLLLAMQYRFKRRTLSPTNRLLLHIERLLKGEAHGVRHIPMGWQEVFDKVFQLSKNDTSSK